MLVRKIYPTILQDQLKYIYILESDGNVNFPFHRHLPDGTFELMINLADPIYHYNANGLLKRRPDAAIIGGYKNYLDVRYCGKIKLIGVVFQFGYGGAFLKDRLDLHSRTLVPAELVFGSRIIDLAESLRLINDLSLIGNIVENFLLEIIRKSEPHNLDRITESVRILQQNKGNIDLKVLSDYVCMSQRNFRRVFAELTGYRPKELARVIRAKNLIHFIKQGGSLAEAIYRLGYYDRSHFIKDFKNISGLPPTNFLKQMDGIDDGFMEVSEYLSTDQKNNHFHYADIGEDSVS